MRQLVLVPVLLTVACAAEPARLVSVSQPEDTRDTAGPYVVQAELRGALGDDTLLLCWSTDASTFTALTTQPREGRDDLRAAAIPGQPAGTTVTFVLALVPEASGCPVAADPASLRSFRVLPASLACSVDSDCRLGVEICADATCRGYDGTCAGMDAACPGGYTCDATRDPPACVVPARVCSSHADCPSAEQCDLARGECTARPACSAALACPEARECVLDLGLCALP
jgi:hypothetical protein